jgi:predicted nucleic acid-binding protein
MVLVDTSVWINHFRSRDPALAKLLAEVSVLVHPFVLGELSCGNLKNRHLVLKYLEALPVAVHATHEEASRLMAERKLWECGIGWVDTHLLASALLSHCEFWTHDERLNRAADAAAVRRSNHRLM